MHWLKIVLWIILGIYLLVGIAGYFLLFGAKVGFTKSLTERLDNFHVKRALRFDWEKPSFETLYKAREIYRYKDTFSVYFDSLFAIRRHKEVDAEYVHNNYRLMPKLYCMFNSKEPKPMWVSQNIGLEEVETLYDKEFFLYFENPGAEKSIAEVWESEVIKTCYAAEVFLLKIRLQDSLSQYAFAHYAEQNDEYVLKESTEGILQDFQAQADWKGIVVKDAKFEKLPMEFMDKCLYAAHLPLYLLAFIGDVLLMPLYIAGLAGISH